MLGEKHEQSAWNNALTLVQLCITQTKQRRTFESLFIFSQWQPIPLRSHVELIAMVSGTYCVHNFLFIIRSIRRDWPLLRPYQISKSFHSFKIRVCLSNILMISSYFKQCAWPLCAVGSFNPFHILISNWDKIRGKWWNEWAKVEKNTVHKLYYESTWLETLNLIEVPCTVNFHRNHDVIRDSKSTTASCREYNPW